MNVKEYIGGYIDYARKKFREKDFRADFRQYGDHETLDWRAANGSSDYHIHYVFDTKQQYMYISGDLGAAVFFLTWEPTFENMHGRRGQYSYLVGKIEASSDKYEYPSWLVREEIEEYYEEYWKPEEPEFEKLDPEEFLDEESYQEALKEQAEEREDAMEEYRDKVRDIEATLDEFADAHDEYRGLQILDSDLYERMSEIDDSWYEHDFGRIVAPRVHLWLLALDCAWEQLHPEEAKEAV